MYYVIVSFTSWFLFFLSWFIIFPIICVIWLFTKWIDPNLKWVHWSSCVWGSVLTWVNPLWKVKISGREKIKSDQTYVMICNHQSMLDILVLYRLFKRFKWVSKAELFKIPIVGWNMSLNRYIALNRGSKKSHLQMLRACEENLNVGNSIMIFPEGTRSRDGHIHTFKEGAFMIAKTSRVPIIPIVLKGTYAAFPDKGIIFKNRNVIRINVLDAIPYETFKDMENRDIAKMAQKLISDNFNNR